MESAQPELLLMAALSCVSQVFPVTADGLVGSPSSSLQDGSTLVAGKEVLMYGVDPQNGQVRPLDRVVTRDAISHSHR